MWKPYDECEHEKPTDVPTSLNDEVKLTKTITATQERPDSPIPNVNAAQREGVKRRIDIVKDRDVGTQDKCYKIKQLRIRNTHANPIIVPRV